MIKIKGFLLGVLPNSKEYEFKINLTNEVIHGEINGDAYELASIFKECTTSKEEHLFTIDTDNNFKLFSIKRLGEHGRERSIA